MRLSRMLVVPVALLALAGCSSNNSNVTGPGPVPVGQLTIAVTDAPGNFDAVNLVVDEVSASRNSDDSGWQVLSTGTNALNMLTLQNGRFATLGNASVPAGTYQQLRVKLGAGSNVVVNGVTHPLDVSSGLSVNGSFALTANGALSLQMDLDVSKSITQQVNGYLMNPVVRLVPATDAGAIGGLVTAASGPASVKVSQNGVEICTNWVSSDGSFKVAVLPAGTYDAQVADQHGNVLNFNGLVVEPGQTTSLGSLSLVFPTPGGLPGPGGGGGGGQ
jgi:hypothetical protein